MMFTIRLRELATEAVQQHEILVPSFQVALSGLQLDTLHLACYDTEYCIRLG